MNHTLKKAVISACALTRLTERVAHRTGVGFFLPGLFRLRYANFGGLDPSVLGKRMDELKSFREDAWCSYWNCFGSGHERDARHLRDAGNHDEALASYMKAIACFSISAFPGTTPLRLKAYRQAENLFDESLSMLGLSGMEKVHLPIAGETVTGYFYAPGTKGRHPAVIVTNGLEGTIPELGIPLMRYLDSGLGVFLMEMPGTYSYRGPMSPDSEKIYCGVIDYLAAHEKVDPRRIGMIGLSFGAYWSARMAAADSRLACSVVNGAPLYHAFSGAGSFGVPEVIMSVLKKVTGAKNLLDLRKKLAVLSFKEGNLFGKIKIPILVVNGDHDTLLPTRDSVLLAQRVPEATLKLFENDDHCAMGHYEEMLDYCFNWVIGQLLGSGAKMPPSP